MASYHTIEEMAKSREDLLLACRRKDEAVYIETDVSGAYCSEFEALLFAPRQEVADSTKIGSPSMLASNATVKKFFPGEFSRISGCLNDRGNPISDRR